MKNNKENQQVQINRLRIIVFSLAILVVISAILIVKLHKENMLIRGAGGPIKTEDATAYVKKYTDAIWVFDNTTTSFLLEKSLLDSFSINPHDTNPAHAPTYYRVFFAKNEQGKRTLVITGAYLNGGVITNTHIKSDTGKGYDIEHVFPIDDEGNVYEVDANGNATPRWRASRFPDNTSKK